MVCAAAASGSSQAVRVLVEAGADINAQDHDGWTALMLATHSVRYSPHSDDFKNSTTVVAKCVVCFDEMISSLHL